MKKKWENLKKNIKRDKALLLIILPVVIHYLIFFYYPMYGNIIAFKDYSPAKGIMDSDSAELPTLSSFSTPPISSGC